MWSVIVWNTQPEKNKDSGEFNIHECHDLDPDCNIFNILDLVRPEPLPYENIETNVSRNSVGINDITQPKVILPPVTIASWNIRGISDKLSDPDLQDYLLKYDVIIL